MAHLSHSINGNIALITLNNPPQNRLSLQILDELDVALTAIGDSETRARQFPRSGLYCGSHHKSEFSLGSGGVGDRCKHIGPIVIRLRSSAQNRAQ